ncbi:hypothetical protein NIES4071_68060 [Calothrix sp. NIES-4071]|nr:hypothetical protein NIES4071_68060 [Calothrix sp. NIES-4071]BAZ61084.1 hypothetical protein NIES4105_68020 [Calothrix sp. NIES-4105]
MFTNINQGYAIATQIEVSPTNDLPLLDKPATYYDYLALLPALITATTPLILGVLRKNDNDEKSDS